MSGTKRLAVTGPWHGQMIEPTSDQYETITAQAPAEVSNKLIIAGAGHVKPAEVAAAVEYAPLSYPIPLVRGVAAMPLLVPVGLTPTGPEVLDALVLAAFGEVTG